MTRENTLEQAVRIAGAMRDAGGQALIVGGWVRDRLVGRDSKDVDLEVYRLDAARVRQILEAFGRVDTVGESFTVYKIGAIDVSLPRRESKIGRGHRGFHVIGDPHLSPEEAARRRDFTINAIAWDPLENRYIDPYDGRADLSRHLLKAVDQHTFPEDSLRVLRAVQLAARFDLTIDPETASLCRSLPLDDLPAERIEMELEKLFLRAVKPSIGLRLALDLGVVDKLFPELRALVGCVQEPDWHPEGDVWVHTLLVVDEARTRIEDLARPQAVTLMLGAMCHDLGKPATTSFTDGRIRSLNHEQAGLQPTIAVLDRLNIHSLDGFDVRHHVLGLVGYHLTPGMLYRSREEVGDGAFRRLARKVDLELLARLAKSDCLGRGPGFDCTAMDWFLDRARALGVEHAPPPPLLLGRHLLALGLPPGPGVGAILRQVYERQLDGEVRTEEEAIEVARTLLEEK